MNRSCGVVVGELRLPFGFLVFFSRRLASMTKSFFKTRGTKLFFTVATSRQTPRTDRFFATEAVRRAVVASGGAAVTEPDALSAEPAIATAAGIDVVFLDAGIAFATGGAVPAVEFDVGRPRAVGVQDPVHDLKQIGQAPFGQRRRHRRFPFPETNPLVVDVRMHRVTGGLGGMRFQGDDTIRIRLIKP